MVFSERGVIRRVPVLRQDHRVEIVREDSDGVWVSGLPNVTTLITVGQELVVPGEQVEAVFEQAPAMPASSAPAKKTEKARNTGTSPADDRTQLDANAVAAS